MAEKNETGKTGEHIARSYLERHGLTVLHTNWRFHRYELDLIARMIEIGRASCRERV